MGQILQPSSCCTAS